MALSEGTMLIRMRTIHYGDGRPFQVEDRWINPAAAPGVEKIDFHRINANEWLVRNFPWLHADIAFSAESADARAARARTEADAARLHDAEAQGLLMVELPLAEIDEGAMVRDRMVLNGEDMEELRLSIAANGLRLPIEVFELDRTAGAAEGAVFVLALLAGMALFAAPYFDPPVLALGWAVFIGGLAQLVLQIKPLAQIGMLPRFGLKLYQRSSDYGMHYPVPVSAKPQV